MQIINQKNRMEVLTDSVRFDIKFGKVKLRMNIDGNKGYTKKYFAQITIYKKNVEDDIETYDEPIKQIEMYILNDDLYSSKQRMVREIKERSKQYFLSLSKKGTSLPNYIKVVNKKFDMG